MKELKMPNALYSREFDIHITPYLTQQNVIDIAETMLTYDNTTEREIVLAVNLLKECTDIDDETIEVIDIDLVFASGLYETIFCEVMNVKDVFSYIEYKENVNSAIANFFNTTLTTNMEGLLKILQSMEKKVPKGNKWVEVVKELPESLAKTLATMKNDGNAEIVSNVIALNKVKDDD